STGRWAAELVQTAGKNTVRDNILYHPNSARGGLEMGDQSDVNNTDSDYNVLDRVSTDGGNSTISLSTWKASGHETHSLSATPAQLFVSAAGNDYHLSATSPAVDKGVTLASVTTDLEGNPRPQG